MMQQNSDIKKKGDNVR